MEKYNLQSAVLWSARLRLPKPIVSDNHTHFPLTETNGTRQGPGEKVLKATEETPKHQSAKQKKKKGNLIVYGQIWVFVWREMQRDEEA